MQSSEWIEIKDMNSEGRGESMCERLFGGLCG